MAKQKKLASTSGKTSMRSILENLSDLWDKSNMILMQPGKFYAFSQITIKYFKCNCCQFSNISADIQQNFKVYGELLAQFVNRSEEYSA